MIFEISMNVAEVTQQACCGFVGKFITADPFLN